MHECLVGLSLCVLVVGRVHLSLFISKESPIDQEQSTALWGRRRHYSASLANKANSSWALLRSGNLVDYSISSFNYVASSTVRTSVIL